MNYINYINAYENQQAIEAALNAGTLQKPYVALDLSAGTVDFDSITPTPPVPPAETRMKVTYHMDQPGEFILIGEPGDSSLVSVEIDGNTIPLGGDYDYETYGDAPTYTAASSGDYVAYFTFSGDTIGGNDEESRELFYDWSSLGYPIPVVSIEIPDNLPHIGHNSFAYVGGEDSSIFTAVTIPDVPMSFGKEAFRGNKMLQVVKTASMSGTGYVYIPSGSTLDRRSFGEDGKYTDEETYVDHVLLTAVTISSGVSFVDNYWEDDGDSKPTGRQFDGTPLLDIHFLDTVPPTIQVGTFNWDWTYMDPQTYETTSCNARVPIGYEDDYVAAFNSDCFEEGADESWYFGTGTHEDHGSMEQQPTPGYINADWANEYGDTTCALEWGEWDSENNTCYHSCEDKGMCGDFPNCEDCPEGE